MELYLLSGLLGTYLLTVAILIWLAISDLKEFTKVQRLYGINPIGFYLFSVLLIVIPVVNLVILVYYIRDLRKDS